MNRSILVTEDISLGFGQEEIIHHISFTIPSGSFVGILGPNGSGKTTLIRGLSRTIQPQTGMIHLLGKELQTYSTKLFAQHVALVSQDIPPTFDFSVYEIVLMGRNPYIRRFHAATNDDRLICMKALQTVGIGHLADRPVSCISGGERQRVFIARALAQEPDLLLLDEATSHLDISHEIDILSVIRKKVTTEKMTVLGVFHNLNSASFFCDTVILLHNGNIVSEGSPEEVLNARRIHDVFGAAVLIQSHPVSGKPVVIPVQHKKEPFHHKLSIHLICGGGTGAFLISVLIDEGYPVCCGILCHGDQDLRCAGYYQVPILVVEPFQPISKDLIDTLRKSITNADVVIITKMPIGMGNLENISILLENYDKQIFFFDTDPEPFSFAGYDFTSGRADAIIKTLLTQGAVVLHSITDLLFHLAELEMNMYGNGGADIV